MRTTSLANSQSAKFTPQIRDQSREWEYVQDQLRQGQKLVRVFYSVMSVSPYGEGDRHERNLKAEIGRAPSELQSLMRISYAVFCLKKKNNDKNNIEVAPNPP